MKVWRRIGLWLRRVAAAGEMAEWLDSLKWDREHLCPNCAANYGDPHEADCELAALLTRVMPADRLPNQEDDHG